MTETKTQKTTEITQKVQLVDGLFTAQEAQDVVNALIDEKINFHKLQRLSLTEGYIHSDITYPQGRIASLMKDRKECKAFLQKAIKEGYKVKIDGILTIEICK